jgi:hypothetical protein
VTDSELAVWFDAGPTITIVGTPVGLQGLASRLLRGEDALVDVDTEAPAGPHDGAAASIRIKSSHEPGVAAERHGDEVVIVGDRESLAVLGENVDRLAAEPKALGGHIYARMGYVAYMNEAWQTVDPWTGQTPLRSDPLAHWEWGK